MRIRDIGKTLIRLSGKSYIEIAEAIRQEKALPEQEKLFYCYTQNLMKDNVSIPRFLNLVVACGATLTASSNPITIESVQSGNIFSTFGITKTRRFLVLIQQLQQKNIPVTLHIQNFSFSIFDENVFKELSSFNVSKDSIIKKYKNGISVKDICEKYDISHQYVHRVISESKK